jgi:putative ABC transport system permease protein
MASFIMYLIKKFFPRKWSFVFRQGLSNLFRPNNQTQTLIVSIGLGTAVLTTLFIIQGLLLNNVAGMDAGNQPNMILYGIERTQAEEVSKITASYDMPVIQQVPIVTMRLEEWKGRTKEEWMTDTTARVRGWAANREARVTYRDSLDSSEELVKGNFVGSFDAAIDDSIFISLGDSYARGLNVEIGDEMVWNVQGARITTYISSLRKINFDQMTARFFILFPTGVLEEAPQFRVLVTKSPDNLTTVNYRKEVVKAFPNVSVVDLGSILAAVSSILDKVSYIIKFMAVFSILTGLIVLLSSLLLSKYQRIKESVLLRTLGANKRQILSINAVEYALIGALAAAAGILLSIIGAYLLATFQLDLEFNIKWLPIVAVFLLVTFMTMFIGMFNSRDVIRKAPLEVLRKEI